MCISPQSPAPPDARNNNDDNNNNNNNELYFPLYHITMPLLLQKRGVFRILTNPVAKTKTENSFLPLDWLKSALRNMQLRFEGHAFVSDNGVKKAR